MAVKIIFWNPTLSPTRKDFFLFFSPFFTFGFSEFYVRRFVKINFWSPRLLPMRKVYSSEFLYILL
jgi:hypothetical protein